MYTDLLQQLTLNELEKYSIELELAIEYHTKWLSQVNRTLICDLSAEEKDIGEHPHHLCQFGRWYHKADDPALTSLTAFQTLGEVHEALHLAAKKLLLKNQKQQPIKTSDYDALIELTKDLRFLIASVRQDLNHNRNITSMLMEKVFENANEGVIITAPDTTIISVNRAFSEVTGYSAEEVIGKKPDLLQSGKQDPDFYLRMWDELKKHGQWQGEIWNRNKRDEIYLEWLSIAAVRDDKGDISHYVGIFSDITSEKENEERLEHLAHYDQLTGLPNRILFHDRLKQSVALARRAQRQVAVMFLDLDGFKAINDTLGHNAGDELLKLVAQRLTQCLRESDTVSRFGGDEFTIVLPEVDSRESVERIARKITEEIARPFNLEGHEAGITTSVGISIYPVDGQKPDTLVKKADKAMYNAKRHGKNHHEFYSED